jgi:3-hydroxyacyl-CoA dehydrogenase
MKRTIKSCSYWIRNYGFREFCHFANIGVEVYFLISFRENWLKLKLKGLTLENKAVRNRLVNEHLGNALKSKLSIYSQNLLIRSRQEIRQTTWQNCYCWLDYWSSCWETWYQNGFEQVEKYRKPGTLITSNTSGIPITLWVKEEAKISKHFLWNSLF